MPPKAFHLAKAIRLDGPVRQAAWSPDGALLATVTGPANGALLGRSDATIRLWGRAGQPVGILLGHTCQVMKLAWSPDGRTLASASCDGTVRLWRAGRLLRIIRPRAGAVMTVAWSPDGRTLATGSIKDPLDNKIQLWNPLTGKLLRVLGTRYSGGKFFNLAWSPDGKFIVGGAVDYREWNAADGRLVFDDTACAACTPAWGFAWSPDSAMWATGDESGDVSVYRTDGRIAAQLTNSFGPVDTLAWSPDGRLLAGGNTIWQRSGTQTLTHAQLVPRLLNSAHVAALAWSPAGGELAVGFANAGGVYVYGPDGSALATLTGHRGEISTLAWSPNGRVLASAATDRTLRLWTVNG